MSRWRIQTAHGIAAIIAVNAVADDVSVLMRQRQRHIPARQELRGRHSNPYTLAAADFNGDGTPDVVTSNRGANTVSVLLGNGDGTFSRPKKLSPLVNPSQVVAVGDFNGDGQVDIVTANLGDGYGHRAPAGRGDGTFSFVCSRLPRLSLSAVSGGGGRLDRQRHPRHHHRQSPRQQCVSAPWQPRWLVPDER